MPKRVLSVILVVLAVIYAVVWVYLLVRTNQNESSTEQTVFASGTFPNPLPNGFYKGTVAGYSGNWKGKTFDAAKATGINTFGNDQIYPFKTYQSVGLRDSKTQALNVDYNIKENPFWLRFLVDEITQVSTGHYQGKIMAHWIFGSSFTIGYFQLAQ